MSLDKQKIVIIRHAKTREDGITEEGRVAAINTGRELAQSILRQPSPNEMVLFASNSLRVQKTIDAIREGMGLDPDYPIHSLLLDGKYDDVRESELWEPGSIIRQISANVGRVLICTNGQYMQPLAENLGKYSGISYQDSVWIKRSDNNLDYLQYIHWTQRLSGNVSQDALAVMGDDFDQRVSLSDILRGTKIMVSSENMDLHDYIKQRAGYFDRKCINQQFWQKFNGSMSSSPEVITYNPKIEVDDSGEVTVIFPSKEEYIVEFLRASSYLGELNKPFVHPLQWLRYKIMFGGGNLFR